MGGRWDSSICRSTADRGDYFSNTWYVQQNADNEDRMCLGQNFALTEVGYVMVRFLQRFDKVDNSAMHGLSDDWWVALTGRPFHGVKLRLHAAVEN